VLLSFVRQINCTCPAAGAVYVFVTMQFILGYIIKKSHPEKDGFSLQITSMRKFNLLVV
jgi:hypothetical protein